jgi:hypothetical protein
MKICSKLKPVTMHWIIYGLWFKRNLVFNLKYEHAISFINLDKFINHYQMPRLILSKLFVIASGEANVYGSSYYWNFRTSSFKQVACLILTIILCCPFYMPKYVPRWEGIMHSPSGSILLYKYCSYYINTSTCHYEVTHCRLV